MENITKYLDELMHGSLNGCKAALREYGMIDHTVLCLCGAKEASEMVKYSDLRFTGEEGKLENQESTLRTR